MKKSDLITGFSVICIIGISLLLLNSYQIIKEYPTKQIKQQIYTLKSQKIYIEQRLFELQKIEEQRKNGVVSIGGLLALLIAPEYVIPAMIAANDLNQLNDQEKLARENLQIERMLLSLRISELQKQLSY